MVHSGSDRVQRRREVGRFIESGNDDRHLHDIHSWGLLDHAEVTKGRADGSGNGDPNRTPSDGRLRRSWCILSVALYGTSHEEKPDERSSCVAVPRERATTTIHPTIITQRPQHDNRIVARPCQQCCNQETVNMTTGYPMPFYPSQSTVIESPMEWLGMSCTSPA